MNLLFYCLSFLFILYFFYKFHKTSILNEKKKLVFFSILFIIFAASFNPYFDWRVWILISILLYCVLDDIFHKEFNILLPIFVSIIFLILKPSLLTFLAILFVFLSFYAFALFISLIKRISTNKNTQTQIQKPKSLKELPSYISQMFSQHSGLGEGDPWIICSFLLLIPILHWIPYLFLTWILIIIFFVANRLKKNPSKSIPFAPILLLSLTIYLLLQQHISTF